MNTCHVCHAERATTTVADRPTCAECVPSLERSYRLGLDRAATITTEADRHSELVNLRFDFAHAIHPNWRRLCEGVRDGLAIATTAPECAHEWGRRIVAPDTPVCVICHEPYDSDRHTPAVPGWTDEEIPAGWYRLADRYPDGCNGMRCNWVVGGAPIPGEAINPPIRSFSDIDIELHEAPEHSAIWEESGATPGSEEIEAARREAA